MGSFSGFTPSGSAQTIKNVRSIGREAHSIVEKANEAFFQSLVEHWYSPTAVTFDEAYEPRIYRVQETIISEINDIVRRATAAYNSFASVNEMATLSLEEGDDYVAQFDQQNSTYGRYTTLQTEKNGVSGMEKENVATDVATLSNQYSAAASLLDTLPDAIEIYDPNGDIQAAYSTLITSTKQALVDLITDISSATQTEMGTRTDEVTQAEQSAQDAVTQ